MLHSSLTLPLTEKRAEFPREPQQRDAAEWPATLPSESHVAPHRIPLDGDQAEQPRNPTRSSVSRPAIWIFLGEVRASASAVVPERGGMIWKRTQRQGPAIPRLVGSEAASPTHARVCLPHARPPLSRLTLHPRERAPPTSVQGVNSGQPGELWHTAQQGEKVPEEGTGLQRLRDFRTTSARTQTLCFGTL